MFRTRVFLAALLTLFICMPEASAMSIVTRFIGGAAPVNAAGGGNLTDIVNAAAHIWESVYSDPVTITIYYGWGPVGDAGTHTLLEQGNQPNREISGMIVFDNSGAASFYLDPTPNSNEEYQRHTEEFQDLGGGSINVARVFHHPAGEAVGRIDLLSVALHEIGHAMGLCAANESFVAQSRGGVIVISGDLPFAGTVVPLASNNSGTIAHFDLNELSYGSVMGGVNGDERRMPSQLDIVTNAELSGFAVTGIYPQLTSSIDQVEVARNRAPVTGLRHPVTSESGYGAGVNR